ncbi:non-specific lipid-transfer protein [Genlisea aurea]|uniref:Non-specific lipid-transfer protein n=1 Tax=Genlisea aurea TaxID=192259 RepID=S8E821_9LAMI|nr:non-specific lipid-transfer protein [Genlisea aurea]
MESPAEKKRTAFLASMMMVMMASMMGPTPASAIVCTDVTRYLIPCIGFLTGSGSIGPCCGGVSGLYNAARSTPDKQTVCNCLKNLAQAYPSIAGRAAGLPGQCGVQIGYSIDPHTDCRTVR